MKMNVFASGEAKSPRIGSGDSLGHAGALKAIDLIDPEEQLIKEIDEQKLSYRKLKAQRFLTFLGNNRLNLESLELLPKEEQNRLRKEFLENFE